MQDSPYGQVVICHVGLWEEVPVFGPVPCTMIVGDLHGN